MIDVVDDNEAVRDSTRQRPVAIGSLSAPPSERRRDAMDEKQRASAASAAMVTLTVGTVIAMARRLLANAASLRSSAASKVDSRTVGEYQ